ncbi:MAG: hypothetical protein ACETVM_03875 [Candidatus Bathyarchaeia archaeon]
MIRAKKSAQLRLTTSPTIKRLAEWERPPLSRPMIHKRFAKKRRMERKHVRTYIPKRPLLETLTPSILNNYIIKAIDKWNGEEGYGEAHKKCWNCGEVLPIATPQICYKCGKCQICER